MENHHITVIGNGTGNADDHIVDMYLRLHTVTLHDHDERHAWNRPVADRQLQLLSPLNNLITCCLVHGSSDHRSVPPPFYNAKLSYTVTWYPRSIGKSSFFFATELGRNYSKGPIGFPFTPDMQPLHKPHRDRRILPETDTLLLEDSSGKEAQEPKGKVVRMRGM